MDISTTIRGQIITALAGLKLNNVSIPVFDEVVNPSVTIPTISGAQIYVVIQDQQSVENATQTVCAVRTNHDVTIKVVTKWGLVGSKKVCEDVGDMIINLLRTRRGGSLIASADRCELSVSRTITEQTTSNLAFSKVLILTFINNSH